MSAPIATVVRIDGKKITVTCPYCAGEHVHGVDELGTTERRAPACGLFRSGDDRVTGYVFVASRREIRRNHATHKEAAR